MKKSLSIFLLAAAVIFAAPAQAQFRHGTPKTDAQKKLADKVAEKKAERAAKSDKAYMMKKFEKKELKSNLPVKTLTMGQRVNAPVKKAPRKDYIAYNIPWSNAISTQDDFNQFTVIDASATPATSTNGTWAFYSSSSTPGARYLYNSTQAGDDWLITPGLNLEAGKAYFVEFHSITSSSYPEEMEVKFGNAPTVEAMTGTLMAAADPGTNDYQLVLTPEADGVYYIGFHATSEPDMYYIILNNMSVTLAPSTNTPGEVTDINIIPNEEGKAQAKIVFTAPTVNFAGEALTSLTGVRILRSQLDEETETYTDAEEIANVKRNAAPGAEMQFSDIYMTDSTMYTYTFIPYNEEGEGRVTTASQWIGLDYPTPVIMPTLTDENGQGFKLEWEPSEAANGGVFFPEDVLYQVCTLEEEPYLFWNIYYPYSLVGEVTGETSFYMSYPMDEDEPWALQLGVLASNKKNESWDYFDAPSNAVYIGAPSVTPVAESFPNGELENIWLTDGYQTENGYYYYDTDIYLSEESVDGDNGSVQFVTGYADEEEADLMLLKSWKLSLAGTTKPQLMFARKFDSAKDEPSAKLIVKALTAEGSEVEIAAKELTAVDEDWVKETFDLSSFIDNRYIWLEFGLEQEGVGQQMLLVDNIHIGDIYDVDADVVLDAPESVVRGNNANISVIVKNNGDKDIESYRINVTVGNETLVNYTIEETLKSLYAKEYNYTYNVDKLEKAAVLPVKVTVTVESDLEVSNNTATAIIAVTSPDLAVVKDLKLDDTEAGRVLSWTAPEVGEPQEVTESFEDGEGSFYSIDADGDGFDWYRMVDTEGDGYPTHSGTAAMWSHSYDNNYGALTPDNWLITPTVLDGTFKFWARGADASWAAEHFAVFVSTESGTDVSTFQQVSEEYIATADFTEYSVDLSNYVGAAGWVAIRHFNVTDQYVLVVDDVTYMRVSPGGDIVRFNVYRNGNLLAQTPEATFTDADELADGEYTYQVTITYETGEESAPVAVVYTQTTDGIMQVLSYGKPFDVYTVDGKLVRQNTTTLQGLNKGVYVVNGKKIVK